MAAINIISTLVMAVTDKQADIAILRTLGASAGLGAWQIFMVQGMRARAWSARWPAWWWGVVTGAATSTVIVQDDRGDLR